MADVGTATFRAVADFSQVIRESKRAGSALQGLDAQAARVGTSGTKGTTGFADKLGNLADQATSTGKRMSVGLTAPLVAVGGLAVKTFASFESSLVSAGARSGATADQLTRMKDVALEMGATTKFSAAEAAAAMDTLASAGLTAEETLNALPAVLLSAQASGSDLAFTAGVVAKSMNAFNIPAEKAGHIADVLAQAANTSAIDMEGLGLALGDAGQLGASAGQDIEDVVAAISHLVNQGVPARSAGDAVRQAMDSLAAPANKARTLMRDLGLEVRDSRGEMLPWPKLMQNMQAALSTTNPEFVKFAKANKLSAGEARDNALNLLFGVEGMKAVKLSIGETKPLVIDMAKETGKMSSLAAGLEQTMGKQAAGAFIKAHTEGGKFVAQGADAVVALAAMNRASDGTSKKFSDLFSETTAQTLDNLIGSIETLAVTVIDALGPALDDNINKLTRFIQRIGEFAKAHPQITQMAVAFGLVLAVMGPLLFIAGQMAKSFLAIGAAAGAIKRFAFGAPAPAAAGPGPAPARVKAPLQVAAKAVSGAVITSVKALGTALAFAGRMAITATLAVGRFVLAAARLAVSGVVVAVRAIGTALLFVGRAALIAGRFLLLNPIGLILTGLAVAAFLIIKNWSTVKAFLIAAWTAIKTAFLNGITFIVNGIRTWLGPLVAWWKLQWTLIQTAAMVVWAAIKLVIIGALTVIRAYITGWLAVVRALWTGFWTVIRTVATVVWAGIKAVVSAALAVLRGYFTAWTAVVRALWGVFWAALRAVASVVWPPIRAVVSAGLNGIRTVIATVLGGIKAIWAAGWNGLKAVVSAVWGGIIGVVAAAVDRIAGLVGRVTGFLDKVNNLASGLKDKVGGIVGKLPGFRTGGQVPGRGPVPILAHGGEWVVPADVVGRPGVLPLLQSLSAGEAARIATTAPAALRTTVASLPAQRAAVTRPGGQSQVTNYHLNNPQFTTPNPRRIYEQIRADTQFKSLAGGAEVA